MFTVRVERLEDGQAGVYWPADASRPKRVFTSLVAAQMWLAGGEFALQPARTSWRGVEPAVWDRVRRVA